MGSLEPPIHLKARGGRAPMGGRVKPGHDDLFYFREK
jgi:hypothetical protein